jgi:hypothetical protein
MATHPLLYAAKNFAWKSTLIVPILRSHYLLEWRRIRIRYYVQGPEDRMQFFQQRLQEEQTYFRQRYEALYDHPQAMWWRSRCRILGTLPRPLVLAPLLIELKVSELVSRFDLQRPRTACWSYWLFDLVSRATVIGLNISMLGEAITVTLEHTPAALSQRITQWATISTFRTVLIITTANAVALNAMGELSGQERRMPRLQRTVEVASTALYTGLAKLPDFLGDVILLFSLPKLQWWGRTIAIGRILYTRRSLFSSSLKTQLSGCWGDSPQAIVRRWEEIELARLRQDADCLREIRDQKNLPTGQRLRATKYLDHLCFRRLTAADRVSPEIQQRLFSQMSEAAQAMVHHFDAQDYARLPQSSLGVWAAQNEESPAALKAWILRNPAEQYAYSRQKGGFFHTMRALALLPELLLNRSLAEGDLMPWGRPEEELGVSQFRLLQARMASSPGSAV